VLLAVVLVLAAPARAADPVQRVDVRLTVEGGEPHPLVVQRILQSIESAAGRLLLGRDSELVARESGVLAGVLREVADRVVTGYRVTALGFEAGATTVVAARLAPLEPVLRRVPVVVAVSAVHADAEPLVRAALEPVIPELARLAANLPAGAIEWAGPLLEGEIAGLVGRAAPGFTGTGRVEAAPVPRVAVTVSPRDARIVRGIGVRFRSGSIPYILLDPYAPQIASMAEPVRGLPVAFAAARRAELEALIAARLAAYEPVRQYAVIARPTLQVAEATFVLVQADSTLYRGRVEARLNFGSQAPPADVRVQIGRAFGSLEPYVQLTLTPSTLGLQWAVGARFDVGTHLALGASISVDAGAVESFVVYRLSPDLAVRGTYTPARDAIEGALTYRLNEFLSWEAVGTSRGLVWLRLVSNL
jgi:hypothetical protein